MFPEVKYILFLYLFNWGIDFIEWKSWREIWLRQAAAQIEKSGSR